MSKITKVDEVLQEAEFSKEQVVVNIRNGVYKDKNGLDQSWIHLECVDALLHTNATALDIDIEDLPTLTVKVKNADNRDWSSLIDQTIDVSSAVVVPVISNNQLKSLALSIDSENLVVI